MKTGPSLIFIFLIQNLMKISADFTGRWNIRVIKSHSAQLTKSILIILWTAENFIYFKYTIKISLRIAKGLRICIHYTGRCFLHRRIVCAMDVEKYLKDLKLMKEYYKKYTNRQYHMEALLHENSYKKMNGVVFGGKYEDD